MSRPDLALRLVRSCPVISYDVETTGLDPYRCHAVGYVVAGCGHSVYVPLRHAGGNALDDPGSFEKSLSQAFAMRSRLGLRTVMHNAAFDLWMSAKQGIVPGSPLEDTMINAVLIDDSEFSYSLAACARRAKVTAKLGEDLYEELKQFRKTKAEKDVMQYFWRLPGDHPLVTEYAEGDGITTLELWQHQQDALAARKLERVHALECALIPKLAAIRRRGIRVDAGYAEQATALVRNEVEAARLHFPAGFQPSRKVDVVDYLKGQAINNFPLTKTGKLGTARAFLELSEPGLKVIRLRELEKTEGAFIKPLMTKHMRAGRIHPELVQSKTDHGKGTHTGRFSCVNPNLQQYPKRNVELAKIVRPLIIPDEGFVLADSDVSQQEPRLYAHYSREESLIVGYNAEPSVDVHTITAKLLQIDRNLAKTLGLSLFNGMQVPSLSARLKRPISEAHDLYMRFFSAYPAIRQFTFDAPQAAYGRGYIRTTLGRICHLRYDEIRMAVSRIIQGSAADQMKLLLLRACDYADAYPERIQVLMSIHDSLLWQKRRGTKVREFRKVLEDNSEFYQIVGGQKVSMRVPFPLGTKFGQNWAEASFDK